MVSFVVVQVSIQISLGLGGIRLIVTIGATHSSAVVIVLVAFVISARIGTVIVPIPHADPAKLKFASLTRHVVATLILFDPAYTFGTRLGVGENPVCRFRLVAALFVPSGQIFAVAWRVLRNRKKKM